MRFPAVIAAWIVSTAAAMSPSRNGSCPGGAPARKVRAPAGSVWPLRTRTLAVSSLTPSSRVSARTASGGQGLIVQTPCCMGSPRYEHGRTAIETPEFGNTVSSNDSPRSHSRRLRRPGLRGRARRGAHADDRSRRDRRRRLRRRPDVGAGARAARRRVRTSRARRPRQAALVRLAATPRRRRGGRHGGREGAGRTGGHGDPGRRPLVGRQGEALRRHDRAHRRPTGRGRAARQRLERRPGDQGRDDGRRRPPPPPRAQARARTRERTAQADRVADTNRRRPNARSRRSDR